MDRNVVELINLLKDLPISKWGVGDIRGFHPFSEEFPRVITLAFAYNPDFKVYNEGKFHALTLENKATISEVTGIVKGFLDARNIKYLIPDGKVDENLASTFSLKLAATRSGIGWVGKNSALIADDFGPRFRLSAILVDLDLPVNEPIIESQCGECTVCIDSCPHKCIHNQNWSPGIERDLLFDALKCKHIGHKRIEALGREFSCGICVFSCPKGKV